MKPVVSAGGVPVLPLEAECAEEYAGMADGLLLSGGSVYPCRPELKEGVEHMWHQHPVKTVPGSQVNRMFGESFFVNSRHNNRIGRLAEGLRITAQSPDGVIEAVEHETLPICAFEWHPERMRGDYREPPEGPDMTGLFQWFIEQCSEKKEERR